MEAVLQIVADRLGDWGLITASIFATLFYRNNGAYSTRESAKPIVDALREDRAMRRYRAFLASLLDAIDRFLGRREIAARRTQDKDVRKNVVKRNRAAWSWGLLDFTLFLAILYPALALLIQWVITGGDQDAGLGTLTVLKQEPHTLWRYGALCLAVGCIVSAILVRKARDRTGIALFSAMLGLAFIHTGAFAVAGGVAVAVAVAFAGGFAGAAAIAGGIAFAFAVDFARNRIERRVTEPMPVLLLWVLLLLIVLTVATIWSPPGGEFRRDQIALALLFLGFLPLINALADFLSAGLTRFLLRKGTGWAGDAADRDDAGHGGHLLFWGVVDLLAGAAIFCLLGFAIIGVVYLIALSGGPVLIDLPLLLGGPDVAGSILNAPGDYWWLYATLLSTLLPTALHGVVALSSLLALRPARLRHWIADGLEKGVAGNVPAGREAILAHCGLITASAVIFFVIFWYGALWFYARYPAVGASTVAVFRGFADLIGALPAG